MDPSLSGNWALVGLAVVVLLCFTSVSLMFHAGSCFGSLGFPFCLIWVLVVVQYPNLDIVDVSCTIKLSACPTPTPSLGF